MRLGDARSIPAARERAIIETHPALGERIIAPIRRLREVGPIVRHCHEHFDGYGYPDGLRGETIPIESRIILVCDAYHAMTTDRPYRKRLSVAEACRRLEQSAGTQFDPVWSGSTSGSCETSRTAAEPRSSRPDIVRRCSPPRTVSRPTRA